jgi:NADP-dependent 3-hydroxy acid dehydrogenase YdfG
VGRLAQQKRLDAERRADETQSPPGDEVVRRGVLHGIAAALPVFARQGSGHVVNVVSTAGLKIVPTMGV